MIMHYGLVNDDEMELSLDTPLLLLLLGILSSQL